METNEKQVTCNRCERTMQRPTPHNCTSGFTKKQDFRPTSPPPAVEAGASEGLSPEKLEQFQVLRDKTRAEMAIYKTTRSGDLMVRFTRLEYILDESDALQREVMRLRERNVMLGGALDDARRDIQALITPQPREAAGEEGKGIVSEWITMENPLGSHDG